MAVPKNPETQSGKEVARNIALFFIAMIALVVLLKFIA